MRLVVIVVAGLAAPALAQTILPGVVVRGMTDTPLNTDASAESATRLGLPVREIPATVDVIDQNTMQSRGYRSVTEAVQGSPGVTGGDFPAEPAGFSLR